MFVKRWRVFWPVSGSVITAMGEMLPSVTEGIAPSFRGDGSNVVDVKTYRVEVEVEGPASAVASFDAIPYFPDQTEGLWRMPWGPLEAEDFVSAAKAVLSELETQNI